MPDDSYTKAVALAQEYAAADIARQQAQLDAQRAELEAAYANNPELYNMAFPTARASGANRSMPGSYEGYRDYGLDPVMYQRDPYATTASAVTRYPNGQLGVRPYIGFPSVYPHVIQYPGDNPLRALGLLDAFVGSMWRNLPPPTVGAMRGGMRSGGGAPGGAAPGGTAPSAPVTPPALAGNPDVEAQSHSSMAMRGDPYEAVHPMQADESGRWIEPSLSYRRPGVYDTNSIGLPALVQGVREWFSGPGEPAQPAPTPQEAPTPLPATVTEQPSWFARTGRAIQNWLFPRDPRLAELEDAERRALARVNQRFNNTTQPPVEMPAVPPPVVDVPSGVAPLQAPPPRQSLPEVVNQMYFSR